MGANVVLMSCKQCKIIALLNEYLLISIRTGKETHTDFFSPRNRPHEENLSGSLTVADVHKSWYVHAVCWAHSEDRGIMWDYLCTSDKNHIDMRRTQHSSLSISPTAPQVILSLFFLLLSQKDFFFTASRNFHYIVPSLHSCCPKRASHQWICAHIHHGEKLLAGLFVPECSSQDKPV